MVLDTPIGPLGLVASAEGLQGVFFDGSRRIRCTSRANGVTCLRLGAGKGVRGFRIAREGYAVLK